MSRGTLEPWLWRDPYSVRHSVRKIAVHSIHRPSVLTYETACFLVLSVDDITARSRSRPPLTCIACVVNNLRYGDAPA